MSNPLLTSGVLPDLTNQERQMLDFYFKSPSRVRQLRRGALSEHIDGFAEALRRDSYSSHTARRILSIAGQFSSYATLLGIPAQGLDEVIADRFLQHALLGDGRRCEPLRAMRHLLSHLRRQGVIASPSTPEAAGGEPAHSRLRSPASVRSLSSHPAATLLDRFDVYLRDVRGLAQSTRRASLTVARALLDVLHRTHGDHALQRAHGSDVLEFVAAYVGRLRSASSRAHACSHTRSFLRYLHAAGDVTVELDRAVPRVATVRLASLPPRLPWDQVRTLINAIDDSHPEGLRDKAILVLLAMLGLRSSDVRALELRHIAWRTGELRLPCTKTRREHVLPLLPEVGAALSAYVLHGRPVVALPQVFLSLPPRPGPLRSNTIIWIVRRHLQRAGIRLPRAGAHMLRHSLATRMVNAGVPIKSIADVLGHASIDTTAIYTKVDTAALRAVALPFPGGGR